jgi:3-oxoadipate enol-lactonase
MRSASGGRRSWVSRSAAGSRSTSLSLTPERLWALAFVAPRLAGHDADPFTVEQDARYAAAEADADLEAAMAIELEVWAPLGADERIRRLWHATPDANPPPDGVEPVEPAGAPAKERLGELALPALVVTVAHDPPGFREIGPLIAQEAPDARHVELDSDHYVTLRDPELLSRVLVGFLAEAAAPQE